MDVAPWTEVEAVWRLDPELVYVDLFGFDMIAPACVAAATGHPLPPPDLPRLRAIVADLSGAPVVYRGLRRPAAGAFGLLERHAELDAWFDALSSVVAGQRVLDVQGLWASHGIPTDDVAGGLGHGEPLGGGDGAHPGDGPVSTAMYLEACWIEALWTSRALPPIECVVVDLDLLIRGDLLDDDFSTRNPAWGPANHATAGSAIEAWWSMERGLHEALRIVQHRGIALALVSRHPVEHVLSRFRRRDYTASRGVGRFGWMYDPLPNELRASLLATHPTLVARLALDAMDFAAIAGGPDATMSRNCEVIAERLALPTSSLLFLGASEHDRDQVRSTIPDITLPREPPHRLRTELLHGPRLLRWRSAEPPAPPPGRRDPVERGSVLQDLGIEVGIRKAESSDHVEIETLLVLSREMNLTGARPELNSMDTIYVGTCRDRTQDLGVVCAGLFSAGRLVNWVCSCRVIPHRVAGSLLHLMLEANPGSRVEHVDFGVNTLAPAVIAEARAGVAPWISVHAVPRGGAPA